MKLKKIKTFGEAGPQKYIQKFVMFVKDSLTYLIVGRKGLILDIYLVNKSYNGETSDEFRYIVSKRLMTTKVDSDFFVNIEVWISKDGNNDNFRACTGLGYCYFFELNKIIGSRYNDFSMTFGLHGSISFFKFLNKPETSDNSSSSITTPPEETNQVIVGGKNRELNIIELSNHTNIWKSKSIKRTRLDERIEHNGTEILVKEKSTIWIQDLVIDQTDGTTLDELKIVAATRFGKLLFYTPSLSKYPVDEVHMMDYPIKNMVKVNKDCLIIADSFDNVLLFNFRKQELVNRFKVKTGALSSLQVLYIDELRFILIISSHMDEKLSLYLIDDGFISILCSANIGGASPELFLLETDKLPRYLSSGRHKRVRV